MFREFFSSNTNLVLSSLKRFNMDHYYFAYLHIWSSSALNLERGVTFITLWRVPFELNIFLSWLVIIVINGDIPPTVIQTNSIKVGTNLIQLSNISPHFRGIYFNFQHQTVIEEINYCKHILKTIKLNITISPDTTF